MDFSDIVQQPNEPKPYWKVLDDYERAKATEPELAKLSMPDYAAKMNEVTGSEKYSEGLNDSWVRRAGANIERGLRHFGGTNYPEEPVVPGVPATKGWPTLSETLGGPRGGVDLPELSRQAGKQVATGLGAGPELAEAVGAGAEHLPKTALTVGAGAVLGGIPTIAGLTALETYGETGRVAPSLAAGATAWAIPKAAEVGGQAALRALGAKTVGELAPESISLMDKSLASTTELASKLTPRTGWSPAALTERVGRFTGAQTGMFGAGLAGGVAETVVDPRIGWQDKLKQIGEQFKPSSLIASGVAQLPFTAFDLFNERTHPLTQVRRATEADFSRRFATQAVKGDPESGSPGFIPTAKEIKQAIEGVTTGKIPDSPVGQVLKSMGDVPIVPDLKTPVMTLEAAWPMTDAMSETRTRTERVLKVQGVKEPLGDKYDQTIYEQLRAAETANKGQATKEDMLHQVATTVVNKYWGDLKDLEFQGEAGKRAKKVDEADAEMLSHQNMMAEITDKINPGSPNYDKDIAQRVALVSGDQEHWLAAGITDPVMFSGEGEAVAGISEIGGVPTEVTRRSKLPVTLTRNIIDLSTGMGPKPTLDPEIVSRQQELFGLKRETQALEQFEMMSPEQQERHDKVTERADELEGEIAKLQSELPFRQRGFQANARPGDPQAAIYGTSTAEAVKRAYNYGSLPGDLAKGRVLDLKDPSSVSEFIANIRQAIKRAEIAAVRERAGQRTLSEKYATEEEAQSVADRRNGVADSIEGEVGLRYSVEQDRNGAWRVVEEKFDRTQSFSRDEGPDTEDTQREEFRAQVIGEVMEQAGAEKPTLASHGVNVNEISDNFFVNRRNELGKLADTAEAAARLNALARNAVYYLQTLSKVRLEEIILGHAEAKHGEAKSSIRYADDLRKRMIRYVQYLRDIGNVDLAVQNRVPTPVEDVVAERGRGLETVTPLPEMELMGPRLVATNRDQLLALEKFMGGESDLGFGNYSMTDKVESRRGKPRTDMWNKGVVSNLNFFEQFGALMADMKKKLPDPQSFNNWAEMRPRGDLSHVPPNFRDQVINTLVVKWGPDLQDKPFRMTMKTREGFPAPKEPEVIKVQDRNGKEIRLESSIGLEGQPVNPLQTFFTESARNEYTMPMGQFLDLFERYGALNPDSLAMLEVARKLASSSPFIRDMPVGAGVAKDSADKAYYHTDNWASSAGMLISPFKDVTVTREDLARGVKPPEFYVRELMTPNEIFPHFMNEVGHSAADFAYLRDNTFKKEIDRIFDYVQQHVEYLKVGTAGATEWSKSPLHSLTDPREFLAGMFNDFRLHKLLNSIEDPFSPLTGAVPARGQDTLFTRLKTAIQGVLTRLFGVGAEPVGTLLNRMEELAARGFEIQQGLNLMHRGDVYHEMIKEHQKVLGRVEAPTGKPPPWWQVEAGTYFRPYETTPAEQLYYNEKTKLYQYGKPDVEPAPLWAVIRNHESMLADAKANLAIAQDMGSPELVQKAAAEMEREQINLRLLRRMQTGRILPGARGTEPLREARKFPQEMAKPQPEKPGVMTVTPEGQVHVGGGVAMPTFEPPGGQILESRLVPEEGERVEIAKPIFNIQGRKGVLLRDPVVNNIVSTFTAGQRVKDAFSGSGQLSAFARNAGAERVSINVYRPEMHSIFDEIKSNPIGFGRRVANVARQIDSSRNQIPRMRDGSDLRTFLDGVQTRDPNVGLYMKQNLNYFGREVGKEGTFTPSAAVTNQGLTELPTRIRRFAKAVDEVTKGNGWDVVAKAQPGERVMVDPPYVGKGRYGETTVAPEQRVAEYEKYLYPAAENGAHFLVFDAADPQLMESLADHGFTVQPVQRTARRGGAPRTEFVAYNHNGEILASKVSGQKVLDSMESAAVVLHEDPDKIWFKPYDFKYFRDSYGPALGAGLKLEMRNAEMGYSVNKSAINGLTSNDVARMPKPVQKAWSPSLFETMQSMFSAQGSGPETASALATQMLQYGALLKDTDMTHWGKLADEKTATGMVLGKAWGYSRIAGLTPKTLETVKSPATTIMHETAHTAGIPDRVNQETPDVRAAYKQVTDVFGALDENGRRAFLDGLGMMTAQDGEIPGRYEKAVTDPAEFAAEYMSHVGDIITNVPDPSVYMREQMRFVPDELSRLLINTTLRRMQGLDKLAELVKLLAAERGLKNVPWQSLITDMADAFKSLARPALDIANDQAEFYRTRNMFPDIYRGLLKNLSENLAEFGEKYPTPPPPDLASSILASREGIEKTIRGFFKLPDTAGNLPTKLGFWDKELTQFGQFADKYPTARAAWDMFATARALFNGFKIKMHTALAGAFEGGKPSDDARTKDVHGFIRDVGLRDTFGKIVLDLNLYGDTLFNKELAQAGDVMEMRPEAVTGWLTPEWLNGQMTKYGVPDKDKAKMMTVLDGTRNQIKVSSSIIVGSALHRMDTTLALAVARHTDLPPEAARKTAQLLSDFVKLQDTNPAAALDKLTQFQQAMKTPEAYERMLDFATSGWDNIRRLERFLVLRMPYFMSERRPGQFGLFWLDKSDKITSRYFKNDADRRDYITNNNIEPARQTNPGDRDYGISPAVFNQLNEAHTRMKEKLTGLFGEEEATTLAATLDLVTDLRDALNSRDVLKLTTGRDLAPGREELDMFGAHQQYTNAISRAAYNNFIRLEAELVNTSPELANQPGIKDYINRQVKQVLVQDSPLGRQMQNLGFLYYLWGNVSSMVLNMADQLTGMAPMLTMHGASVAGSYNTLRKANLMVTEARVKGRYKDPQIQQMIERARRDGVLGSWIARELDITQDLPMVNRMRATTGKGMWTAFDLLRNKLYQGYGMMKRAYDIIPAYNAEVGFVASVLHMRSKLGGNLSGEQLFKEAQFLKELAIYPGGKENRPGFFQHVPRSAAQSLWSLQTYANGLTTMLGEMIRRSFNPKGTTPAQATQIRKSAAQALVTQTAIAGVLGLPFAQGMVYALQKLFPEHNIEQDIREMLAGLFGDDEETGQAFSSAMAIGIPSSMSYAPDLGSRFALSGVFHVSPYSGVDWTSLVGPSGGILSNAFQGAQAGIRGDPIKGVQTLMPVGIQRIWKSLEEGQTYKTGTGQQVVSDLRPEEIVARAIGFRPARVHRIEEFERLSRVTQDAEKSEQTNWTKQQVGMLKQGRDAEVRQNIARRVADTKGLYPAEQLSNTISREFERETMPVNLRKFGNRATILAQKSLRGVLGTQDEGPGNIERLQLQQSIAARLGLGGPGRGSLRRAARMDQLLQLYPHLTNAQADLLLTHAAASRPSPDLYSELLGAPQ